MAKHALQRGSGTAHFARLSLFLAAMLIEHVACRRPPDFVIGATHPDGPYLNRWYLTPWRRWQAALGRRARENPTWWNRAAERVARLLPNVYLHQFLRDDDDRALHDHPSWGASLMLEGVYIEHTIAAGGIHHRTWFRAGDFRVMSCTHAHRIELPRDRHGQPLECWTLFAFGPAVREWGFHCPERGWVHWREFTAAGQPGEIGPGCDA